MSPGKGTLCGTVWHLSGFLLTGTSVWCQSGPVAGRRVGAGRGPQLGAGHRPPWPGPAPAPVGSGGLVLCLDRKMNEFHYGIAILFHVSGSLRLTCSPGCDKPRHPRAHTQAQGLRTLAGHGAAETLPCPPRASKAVPIHTDSSWEPFGSWGGGKDQGRGLAVPLCCPMS